MWTLKYEHEIDPCTRGNSLVSKNQNSLGVLFQQIFMVSWTGSSDDYLHAL